ATQIYFGCTSTLSLTSALGHAAAQMKSQVLCQYARIKNEGRHDLDNTPDFAARPAKIET
ncbi:hypothetical protein, partial [Sinorhizobium meliloti]